MGELWRPGSGVSSGQLDPVGVACPDIDMLQLRQLLHESSGRPCYDLAIGSHTSGLTLAFPVC